MSLISILIARLLLMKKAAVPLSLQVSNKNTNDPFQLQKNSPEAQIRQNLIGTEFALIILNKNSSKTATLLRQNKYIKMKGITKRDKELFFVACLKSTFLLKEKNGFKNILVRRVQP